MNHVRVRLVPLLITAVLAVSLLSGCSGEGNTDRLGSIEVKTGATVAGTVRDIGGEATGDAVVTLEALIAGRAASVAGLTGTVDPDALAKSSRLRTAVSAADGRYAIGELEAGHYLLTTSLRDHAGATAQVLISAPAAALGETTLVDINLMPTGTILGQAMRENAADHSGTIVFVDGTSYVAVTDAAGGYSLSGVPIGLRPVHATYPGFLDDTTTATLAAAGDSTTAAALFLRQSANIPPVITFVWATTEQIGTPTTFSGNGTDADGTIVRWEWDFQNDGIFDTNSGLGADAQHTYPAAGTYLAKLRATDNQGGVALAVTEATVFDVPSGAVFVAESGSDAQPGTSQMPVRTIAQGLVLAKDAGLDSVLVATGDYTGVVDLVDGVSIYGGRDPATWAAGAGYSHLTGDTRPVRGADITGATRIERLFIEAADSFVAGGASVAVSLEGCTDGLVFADCLITAGNGGAGSAGNSGGNGAAGANGGPGLNGACDAEPFVNGASGGAGYLPGGNGGAGGNSGGNGSHGANGASGSGGGGAGGSGGTTGSTGTTGQSGAVGVPGTNGAGGTSAASLGQVSGGVWQSNISGSGLSAVGGRGGGGGGGGGGQVGTFVVDGVGGAGGGGGGGGFPGLPGSGGGGGGASIGFLLEASTPLISNCTITTGNGGFGGAGGAGGLGGAGGTGGTGGGRDCSEVGFGGNGGGGGAGGRGGGGAGGPGGPSFGLLTAAGGNVADISTITFQIGNGGGGGVGGASAAPGQSGTPGASGNIGAI